MVDDAPSLGTGHAGVPQIAFGLDRRESFIVETNRHLEECPEPVGEFFGASRGRPPIPRERQRMTDDDLGGLLLSNYRSDGPQILWPPDNSNGARWDRDSSVGIGDGHADSCLPNIESEYAAGSLSHR